VPPEIGIDVRALKDSKTKDHNKKRHWKDAAEGEVGCDLTKHFQRRAKNSARV
jgi:hypothetical protein